jgi:hypothetical protein
VAGLARARRLGDGLLVDVGARGPAHIDPIETAKHLGIEVTFGHLTGATARIFRNGARARIRVSDRIVTVGRRRFSIMHEIGHYLLNHALPTEGDEASWFATCCAQRNRSEEREADVFAVEHLTPVRMVRPYCEVTPVNLHAVRAIADVFTTSPVMSAMRFVELSSERCAAVYSEAGLVKWAKRSRTFSAYIAQGTRLALETVAGDYFDRGVICDVAQSRPAETWLGSSELAAADVEIMEHATVIPEPGWGGVLSLLWIPRTISAAA